MSDLPLKTLPGTCLCRDFYFATLGDQEEKVEEPVFDVVKNKACAGEPGPVIILPARTERGAYP